MRRIALSRKVKLRNKLGRRLVYFFSTGVIISGTIMFMMLNVGVRVKSEAHVTCPAFSFRNPVLISGTSGALNSVYRFNSVLTGVDAHMTISAINNGASISTIDIPQSTAGYEDAFQPYITYTGGSSGSPATYYMEFTFRFKKAGTSIDTVIGNVSITAIDLDGNTNMQEAAEIFNAVSYSVPSNTQLTVTTFSGGVRATSPFVNYSGMDSLNTEVMFQTNFVNVNTIAYRVMAINRSSSVTRQTSLYFNGFFNSTAPLPVQMSEFRAEVENKRNVRLRWTTLSENNNDYFIVERSMDGLNFERVNSTHGMGNSNIRNEYTTLDTEVPYGDIYYRLVQVDFNGQREAYAPVRVKVRNEERDLSIASVFPNPIEDFLRVSIDSREDNPVRCLLVNSSGKKVASMETVPESGSSQLIFQGLDQVPKGTYYISARQGAKISNMVRVVKY
ncbi:MAG: hypothetical protein DWQ48_11615 [Bacteroidetes bacterium]|nr:MAG: hypothetical protein DWQ48_11615 [Bacteroidota bacterium]